MPTVTKQSPAGPTPTSKLNGVLSRIKPLGEGLDLHLKMLMYGRSGTGKTTLWATFPGPILAVICSGGNKPGELKSINTPEYRKKVQQVALDNSQELYPIIDHIKKTGAFKTVVIDHTSGYQDLTLREILGLEEIPAQKSWGMAKQEQYGQSTMMCKEAFRALLNLDANVVLIAQEREFKSDGDSDLIDPTIGPALTPSLTGWLCPACDYVVQTMIRPKMKALVTTPVKGKPPVTIYQRDKGVEYAIRTEQHDLYMTKFRVPGKPKLPEVIVDPDYAKIMALIQSGGAK